MMRKFVCGRNRSMIYVRKFDYPDQPSSQVSSVKLYSMPGNRGGRMGKFRSRLLLFFVGIAWVAGSVILTPNIAVAAENENLAFSNKFMIHLASYSVQDADTQVAVANSSSGLGVGYSFTNDLGGEDRATIPRLDMYYRFNDRHRIDFSVFNIKRNGYEVLNIDVDLEDQTYTIGETLVSDIEYDLVKVGYGYSFYRSDRVELGFSAGLNVTSYDFEFNLADGSKQGKADASGPLPMFGIYFSYLINPNWSLHYLSESFYINIDNALEGSFTNNEFDIQYRLSRSFVLGAGLTRFSTDLAADDSNWQGRIVDSHRGLLVYGSFYM